jgi:hypothetical protein
MTVNNNTRTTRAQSTAASSGPSASEKNQVWQDVLNTTLKNLKADQGKSSYLGDSRIAKVEEQVKKEMEAFIRANPNATLEEIKAKAEQSSGHHQANGVFDKMRDDNFFSKLMQRRKDLMRDLWG